MADTKSQISSFFPERNELFSENDYYYIAPDFTNFEELSKDYSRKTTQEATNLKLQYFSIEKELLNSFLYVNPIFENLTTSSVKFASIIRESSNLYEQTSRIIYGKIFKEYDRISIHNYLTLDKFLNLNNFDFISPLLKDIPQIKEGEGLLNPFLSLSSWNRESKIESKHVPEWWKAYIKVKHSPNEITKYANLKNAIQSLLASYILINKYLGPGVLSSDLIKPDLAPNGTIILAHIPIKQSKLFIAEDGLKGFSF